MNTNKHEPTLPRIWLLALLGALAISAVFALKGPFQDSHWDAPIYLMRGKHVAETPLLHNFSVHAQAIADATRRGRDARDEGRWFYWPFMRLGNAALLGGISLALGTTLTAIHAAFLLYTFLMAAGAVMGALLAVRVIEPFRGPMDVRVIWIGAVVSLLLYVSSDTYRYLSGTTVAEIPAFFLLSAGALSLVLSTRRRSMALAVLSGVLAFALYTVKIEAIWVAATFGVLVAFAYYRHAREAFWLPAFLFAGATTLVLYLIYAWWFFPLGDPRLIVDFAASMPEDKVNPVRSYKVLIAAGGVLWLALLPALRYQLKNPVLWLVLAWLVLFILPYTGGLLRDGPAQVRVFALIALPLLVGSTLGWSALLHRLTTPGRAAPVAVLAISSVALLAIAHAESYTALRNLPGGWRLQSVREFVSPANYQRVDYPLAEIAAVSKFIYSRPGPHLVLWNWDDGPVAEYIDLARYLGPPLPPTVDVIDKDLFPSKRRECSPSDHRLEYEAVFFCTKLPAADDAPAMASSMPILQLHRVGSDVNIDTEPRGRPVFRTETLVVYDRSADSSVGSGR